MRTRTHQAIRQTLSLIPRSHVLSALRDKLMYRCPAAIDEGGPVNLQPVKRPDAGMPHMLPFGDDHMKVPYQVHSFARPRIRQSRAGQELQPWAGNASTWGCQPQGMCHEC